MSSQIKLSCASNSLNRPVGAEYRLNKCPCKFQPKPAGAYTALGFSFSTCQAPGTGLSGCCNKPSACIENKRRKMQGMYNYIQQPILNSSYTVTQGDAIGKSGTDALVAALNNLCDGMDNVTDATTTALLSELVSN